MSGLPWFPFYVRDFYQDTVKMKPDQLGIYIRLLCLAWEKPNGMLEDDTEHMANYCNLSRTKFNKYIDTVLRQKFDLIEVDGVAYWSNKRLVSEKNKANSKRGKVETSQKRTKNEPKMAQKRTKNEKFSTPNSNENNDLEAAHLESHTQSYKKGCVDSARDDLKIIKIYDDLRAEIFGEPRAWPDAKDATTADRFLKAGADAKLCGDVFKAILLKFKAKGNQPPSNLKYFEQPIVDAIAELSKPNLESEPYHDERARGNADNKPSRVTQKYINMFGGPVSGHDGGRQQPTDLGIQFQRLDSPSEGQPVIEHDNSGSESVIDGSTDTRKS